MRQPLKTTVYVEIAPSQLWNRDLSMRRATNKKPTTRTPGTVLLKLTLQLPANAFDPVEPEATIVIPEGSFDLEPVVTVEDPE